MSTAYAADVGRRADPRATAARARNALAIANAEVLAKVDAIVAAGLWCVVIRGAGCADEIEGSVVGVRLTVQGFFDEAEAVSTAEGIGEGSGGELSAYVTPRRIE